MPDIEYQAPSPPITSIATTNTIPTSIVVPAALSTVLTTAHAPRPSLLSLVIKERAALYAAYMPFIEGGGLFMPTQ